jgi:hypothetical protein
MSTLNDRGAVRYPDIPTAGFSTQRQRQASDWMQDILRTWERDRLTLLVVVCSGQDEWRKTARKTMRGMLKGPHLDEVLDEVWRYLCILAGPDPFKELQAQIELRQKAPWQKAAWLQR